MQQFMAAVGSAGVTAVTSALAGLPLWICAIGIVVCFTVMYAGFIGSAIPRLLEGWYRGMVDLRAAREANRIDFERVQASRSETRSSIAPTLTRVFEQPGPLPTGHQQGTSGTRRPEAG